MKEFKKFITTILSFAFLIFFGSAIFDLPALAANCANTSTGFPPLMDLGTNTYKSVPGGLYPNGLNQPPTAYGQDGLSHAAKIQPLNVVGQPDANGKVVLLSIGMSNTTMEYSGFKKIADPDPQKNPQLVIVDGAQGGQDAEIIKNPTANFWSVVDQRLTQSGVSGQQVQVVWLKEAIAGENEAFPADAQHLQRDLRAIVQILAQRFPFLQIIYVSSRTYAGYATTTLNPEPYAYQSGFAVKWLIEDQIKNPTGGPWLAWGPYLWTDGTKGRSDGLVWACDDVRSNDGTHPSDSGVQKVANLLLNFFKTDSTAVNWFLRLSSPQSSIALNVPAGGAGIATTLGMDSTLQAGYAMATLNSNPGVYGTAVFRLRQNGVIVSEVGVPASPPTTAARIFIDYRTGVSAKDDRFETSTVAINTGFAIVNTASVTANITYTLRDKDGQTVASGTGILPTKAHSAKFIDQLNDLAPGFALPSDFSTSIQFGSLEISSSQPISVLPLRQTSNQRGDVLYTSTSMVDETLPPSSGPAFFAHFVDGLGYRTIFVLLNPSGTAMTGTLNLFNKDGLPLVATNSIDGTSGSSFTYRLPPQGIYVFQSDGAPASVNVGWAKLTPGQNSATPVGAGVFSQTVGGILITESGIPSATPTTHARIFIDESGGHDTGLAIANPSTSALNVTVNAYQRDGITAVGNNPGLINMTGNAHTAAFAGQMITGLPVGFTGVLDISAPAPFVALTLRSLTNSRGEALLTTFPIADFNRPAPLPIIFPQVADGSGFQTQFILLNTAGSVSTTLNFFGDDGSPLRFVVMGGNN